MGNGSIDPKLIHKMSKIQDAYYARSKNPVTKRLLVSVPRLQRWILAHSRVPTKKTIFGLHIQKPEMAVQSYALWPEHRTQNFHETSSSYRQSYGRRRDMVFTISRRPSNSSTYKGAMPTTPWQSSGNSKIIRLDLKSRKISPRTSTNIRMARGELRPHLTFSQLNTGPHGRPATTADIHDKIKILFKKKNHEITRSSQLDRTDQHDHSVVTSKNKNSAEGVQKTSPQCPDSSHQGHEAQPDQMDQNTSDPTTIREPYTYRDNTNRCVIKRLGLPNQSESIRRKFRPVNEQLVNKLVGTAHNMVRLAHGYTEEPSYSSAMRQLHSGGGNQTRYHNSAPTINGDRADMEENYYDGMDPNGITYTRKVQHNRRSVEPKGSTINRMVLTRQRVQKYPKDKSRTAGRLVRYTPKPQTGHLRIPVSRSESNSSGCNVNPLEPMETPVPLSPVIHDFEGFEQIVRDEIQERNTDNTRNALQTMVHGTETPTDPIISNESSPTADCSGQDGESSQPDQTSRLAIIEAGYKKQYPELPPEAIKLMARPVRKVSMKEYQQKWKAFILFLRSKNMQFDKISVTNVIQFLCFLFYERNLSPGTVTHYRTALVVPLQIYFNIDLKIPAVTDILRAMCLQRPKTPSSAPAWSLNKVLEFLERLPTDLSMEMLLRKTAFLLLLATGWRISELQACVRDLEFCFFTRDSSLRIRPHPSFLAKNERSQERWEHKEIKVLKLQDGSISKLCPVTSLKSYLKRTSKFRKGKLFLTPGNPQKIMSVYSLSKLICDVILMADPATKAKVHDVRKYASACSYASTMLTGELVQAMNWNSPVTFFKFYFCQTEPLNRPVSLPLQNRTEQ